MLMLIAFLTCGYVVLHAPGHGVAEVLGVIALGLMLGVPMLTGYAQWWEILAIFVGLALVGLEILVPGHFVPGIVGGILTLGGLVMTFVPTEPGGLGAMSSYAMFWSALERGLLVVSGAFGVSVFLWIWLNRYLPSLPILRRLILTEVSGGRGAVVSSATLGPEAAGFGAAGLGANWPMPGSVGRAVSELKPGGSAAFFDPGTSSERQVAVISDAGFVAPGTSVVVREVAGNRVVIHPC
jgi:membrane-bound ClpP family serine protease